MKLLKHIQTIILIILFILYITLICLAFCNLNNSAEANTPYTNQVNIILDAGHGGEDGGASANGIIEKDINLSITKLLNDIFKSNGFNVINTRTVDKMINTDGSTLRERKVSDMKNRLNIYNNNTNNVIISIHQNKFSQEKYWGTQIFYSPNTQSSETLAEYIQDSVCTFLQPENKRECKKADRNIYLLNNSENTAVIIECGFLSNIEESQKLKTVEYQKQLAFSIYAGFMKFYNN